MHDSDEGLIIKNQYDLYYTGIGIKFDKLRFAKIYHSRKFVDEAIKKIEQKPYFNCSVVKVHIEVID